MPGQGLADQLVACFIHMPRTKPGVPESMQIDSILFCIRLQRPARRECVNLFSVREFTNSQIGIPEIVDMEMAHDTRDKAQHHLRLIVVVHGYRTVGAMTCGMDRLDPRRKPAARGRPPGRGMERDPQEGPFGRRGLPAHAQQLSPVYARVLPLTLPTQ